MFDIEVFATSEGLFLNEINIRQSGNMFACLDKGDPLPLLWALDASGFCGCSIGSSRADLRVVVEPQFVSSITHGQLSLAAAIRSLANVNSFATYAKDDKKPLRGFLLGGFGRKIKKALLRRNPS